MKKLILISLVILSQDNTYSIFKTKVFTNSGQISSAQAIVIAEEKFENTGSLIGSELVNIETGNLTGNGKISGPKITIFAKEFNFQGIIDCSDECTIITKKEINPILFSKINKGKFIFKVDTNLELPSTKQKLDEIKNFKGPLTKYWKDCKQNFAKNINPNTSICRICIQFDTDSKNKNSETWKKLYDKVRDISWYLRTQSFSRFKSLNDHLNELPFDELNKNKDIITKVNLKIVKTSDIDTVEDNCDHSAIILSYFIIFDHTNDILKEILTDKELSSKEALNLHVSALRKLQLKRISNVLCDGYFFLDYEL